MSLDDGARAPALLGSQSQLADLGLRDGDEVTLLARPGRLNGRPALVVEEIRTKDRTVSIRKPGAEDQDDFETEGNTPAPTDTRPAGGPTRAPASRGLPPTPGEDVGLPKSETP